MNGPACKFVCLRRCWHAEFVPMVKDRRNIKGRAAEVLTLHAAVSHGANVREGVWLDRDRQDDHDRSLRLAAELRRLAAGDAGSGDGKQ